MTHKIVSKEAWLEARKDHLVKEKEFTRLRDELSQERRDLPWVQINKDYVFDGEDGKESLRDLFAGRSQLIVYHFMFHPDWEEGCKSCSFWADNYDNIIVHLNQRDASMVAISRASLDKLQAYKARMGWGFKWLSSYNNIFNYDFNVSFTLETLQEKDAFYNYSKGGGSEELPGISIFYKDEEDNVFHTYSTYARGLDMLNTAYHYLDLVPKGRDEADGIMRWVRRHDSYEN